MIAAAWPFVLSLAGLAALLYAQHHPALGAVPALAALALGLFFRDPERRIPTGEGLVVSPADGRVVDVAADADAAPGRIAIFLSLFNVHVNRSPVAGQVRSVTYRSGSFRPAYEGVASKVNERNDLDLDGPGGRFGVSQIAGIVARRIRCFKKPGDPVARGERIGYIAFGSRTELTLPPGARILVSVGQKVRGGESVVARMPPGAGGGA